MTSAERKFSFTGTLRKRCNETFDGSSDERQCYIGIGMLRYVGKCRNGTRCEVPIEDEPRNVDQRFDDSRAPKRKKRKAGQDDDDGSAMHEDADDDNGSQAIEVPDYEEPTSRNSTASTSVSAVKPAKVFQKRKQFSIVLRDNGRLILPHVGMTVHVYLRRSEPVDGKLAAQEPRGKFNYGANFRNYVYDIMAVIHFESAHTRPSSELLSTTLAAPMALIIHDTALEYMHRKLAESRVDRDSQMGREAYRRQRMLLNPKPLLNDAEQRNLDEFASILAKDWRAFLCLESLCKIANGFSVRERLPMVLQSFRGLYAGSFNQTLVFFNESIGAHRFRGNLSRIAARLSLHSGYTAGRIFATASFRELLALVDFVASVCSRKPHYAINTSGMITLPDWYLLNCRRVLTRYDGIFWQPAAQKGLTKKMIDITRRLVPDAPPETEQEIAMAAQTLLRIIQQHFRMFTQNTMLEVYRFVESRGHTDARLASLANRNSPILRGALTLLLKCGALCGVPQRTVERASSYKRLQYTHAPREVKNAAMMPLLLCTRQQWHTSNELVRWMSQLQQVRLVAGTSGGYIAAPSQDAVHSTLYIYCSTVPRFVGDIKESRGPVITPLAIAFSTLFGRMQDVDNDSQHVVELMSFSEFVLCDAHLLDEVALQVFFRFMATHRRVLENPTITLLGDCNLYSPFSAIYDNKRGSRVLGVDVLWPVGDKMQELRHHCAQAVVSGASMQKFVQLYGVQKQLTMKDAVASIASNEKRRFIVVTQNQANYNRVLSKFSLAMIEMVEFCRRVRGDASCEHLQKLFARAASDSDLLRSHVLFASPFVGMTQHRVCARVEKFFLLRNVRNCTELIESNDCIHLTAPAAASSDDGEFGALPRQAVSLDNALLFVELSGIAPLGVDHRRCCSSWHRDVLRVARHRNELISQSFALARDALPSVDTAYSPILLMDAEYRFPDIYNAVVKATPCCQAKLRVVDCNLNLMPHQMLTHHPRPSVFLGDLIAEK